MKWLRLVFRVYAPLIAILVGVCVLATDAMAQMTDKKSGARKTTQAAQNPFDGMQHFSAVMNGGLIADSDRKIYRSGKWMRTDFADQYRVTDIDIPVTWVVFAKTETRSESCARFEVADAGDYPFWGLKDFRVEHTSGAEVGEGKETVDGHSCKIENLTFVNSKVNPAVTVEMKIWEAEDLKGFPIKIAAHNLVTNRRFEISYTNVSLETPDPKLFVHPDKCGQGAQRVKAGDKAPALPTTPTVKSPPQ